MRRSPRVAAGFTLLELVIVGAVVAVVTAVLVPAVTTVRDQAARGQCSHNLKQLGLALQQYVLVNGAFPWGHQDAADTRPPSTVVMADEALPWSVFILPQLGEEALFRRFNTSLTNTTPGAQPFFDFNDPSVYPNLLSTDASLNPHATQLKVYACPSSPSQGVVYTDDWTAIPSPGALNTPMWGSTSWTVSASDYQATSGVTGHYLHKFWNIPSNPVPYPGKQEGVLQDNYRVSIDMITDGLSNTTLVGEVGGAPNLYGGGKQIASPPYNDGAGNPIITPTNPSGFYPQGTAWADTLIGDNWLYGVDQTGTVDGICALNCGTAVGAGFYSFHRGGANFLFADGSVRFVSAGISGKTLLELVTIQGRVSPGSF